MKEVLMAGPIERVTAALELREPDRVPTLDVMEELTNIYDVLGKRPIPISFLFRNPVTGWMVDKASVLVNRFVIDGEMDTMSYDRTLASIKLGYDSAWVMHVPIWRFHDTNTTRDIYGRFYDVVFDGKGNLGTPMYRGGLIKSPDDWKAWDKRDIFRLPARANKVWKRIQGDLGERIYVFASFLYGIFENSWQPLGFDRWAVAMRREKEFMRRYIKFYEDFYCLMVEAIADAGIPGIIYSDDHAYRSGPMLNPKMMEDWYGDAFRRIVETAHKLGMKMVVHSDGNLYPLLEWYADCGFDGVHALEPTAGMELAKVKEMVGDRMCLLGNIDVTRILVDASKEEVYEAVRQAIEDAGKGGGYIVAPTNSHPGMSPRNITWMLEATEKYGGYGTAG
jgi:uroporphyrinogen decarboxylase